MMTYGAVKERMETLGVRMAREGWIIHPQRGRIRFMARDYQRTFWNDKSRLRIICKARQIGMSQAVGAEVVDKAMKKQCTILLISRNEDQAIVLLNYCKTIYYNLDDRYVELVGENTRRMTFANGSVVVSLPANKSTGRGFAASHVYIDEAAHMMFADMIWQSIAPSVSTGGTVTMLSSPLGPSNLFGLTYRGFRGPVKDFDGATAPSGTWSRHFIPWQRNPEYTTENPGWYNEHRQEYTDDQWASEMDASLAASGELVFKPEYIAKMIDGWIGVGSSRVTDDELIDPTDPLIFGDMWYMPSVKTRIYVTGWDIGRKNDPTVGITLDVTEMPYQLVAFERFYKMPYDEIEERIIARYEYYPGWHAMDATGIGDPVWEALTVQGYEILPFVMTRISKPNMVNELVRSIEHEILKSGLHAIQSEMEVYRRKDENIVQDTIMALGIANYTAMHVPLEQTMEEGGGVNDVSRNFAAVGE